jgi:hypothetical protein
MFADSIPSSAMKINLRDSQVEAWKELAELIGAKHPADAIAFIGARYLPGILAQMRESAPAIPPRSRAEQLGPVQPPSGSSEFDDLFDSIER